MLPLAGAAQMQELDRCAIQDLGIPSLDLMEHAAEAVVSAVDEAVREGRRSGLSELEKQQISRQWDALNWGKNGGLLPMFLELCAEGLEKEGAVPRAAVFCGPGNNGGDGLAAARLLMDKGYEVRTFFLGNRGRMTADSAEMARQLEAKGGTLEPFHVEPEEAITGCEDLYKWILSAGCLVDALFGIGLTRPLQGDYALATLLMNCAKGTVVACDIPSGVHTDTGEILGTAVRADITVTFTLPKLGLVLGQGRGCAGEVRVADIGIPKDLVEKQVPHRMGSVRTWSSGVQLPRRLAETHKGDYGRVLILGGSQGYTGAPVMAATAALRTGSGLVSLMVPEEIYPITAARCMEVMPSPLPKDFDDLAPQVSRFDAVLMGPGLGHSEAGMDTAFRLAYQVSAPLVVDADGLSALIRHNQQPDMHIDVLELRHSPTVLTPHDGEFARLTGCPLPIPDRLNTALKFARENHCILVLKGHTTITAGPDGTAWLNTSGNPGMAKGGSGDVLAGMIVSLLGQKLLTDRFSPLMLTAAAVAWHGEAGDLAAEELGEYGMTPTDLLQRIPLILKRHTEPAARWESWGAQF